MKSIIILISSAVFFSSVLVACSQSRQQATAGSLEELQKDLFAYFREGKMPEGLEVARKMMNLVSMQYAPTDSVYRKNQGLLYSAYYLNGLKDSAAMVLLDFRNSLPKDVASNEALFDRMYQLLTFKHGKNLLAVSRSSDETNQEMIDRVAITEEELDTAHLPLLRNMGVPSGTKEEMENFYKQEYQDSLESLMGENYGATLQQMEKQMEEFYEQLPALFADSVDISSIEEYEELMNQYAEQMSAMNAEMMKQMDEQMGNPLSRQLETIDESLSRNKKIDYYLSEESQQIPDYFGMTQIELKQEEEKLLARLDTLSELTNTRADIQNNTFLKLVLLYAITERHEKAIEYIHMLGSTKNQDEIEGMITMALEMSSSDVLGEELGTESVEDYAYNFQKMATVLESINQDLNQRMILAIAAHFHKKEPAYADVLYRYSIPRKDRSLREILSIRKGFYDHRQEPVIQKNFAAWQQLRLELLTKGTAYDSILVRKKETQLKALETEALILAQYQEEISRKEIQSQLKDGQAAIEFIRFEDFRHLYSYVENGEMDEAEYFNPQMRYGAIIVKSDAQHPTFVTLALEDSLALQLGRFTDTGGRDFDRRGALRTGMQQANPEMIYQMVWQPLEEHLADVQRVYYSPVGLLYNVPFWGLPRGKQFMIDRYELHQVSSTTKLGEINRPGAKINSGVLYGDIDYAGNSPWPPLSNTADEIGTIKTLLEKSGINPVALSGLQATEEHFKQLCGQLGKSPGIIHLATHGKTKAEKSSSTIKDLSQYIDVNLQEGNFLFTASRLMDGEVAFAKGNQSAGRLKSNNLLAAELLPLDLTNTQLVVLSACQTGLGEATDLGEGMYGLQYGFRQAGARYLIVSLWEVADEATKELMIDFYTNWQERGMEIPEAFGEARLNLRKKYTDKVNLWAGFTLVE